MNTIAEMGIWLRRYSRSATILNQYRRHNWPFNVSVPVSLVHGRKFQQQEEANILPSWRPHSDAPFFFTRSYAVPAKAMKKEGGKGEVKQAADDPEGPRINNAITSDPVRLVTDEGHQVISRREALEYAKKLKLDLVEVQRQAKPPVCKVMDYNKEKYKQQQREKERTKNKLDLTVRKGECREVRFTAKTEQKDLERKAEMAKRLMDSGYRVKCMAMGNEGQNLEELLLRLSTLIEDVSFVESGPKGEKRNAWMIVRHIKFGGTKKKGTQQTPKTVERTTGENVKDNLKKTVGSERKKEDSVVSSKEQSKEELVQFQKAASFEQTGEHETELASFEESTSFQQFGDNEVEFAPFEESSCFEQFGEHETELVPSIEKLEETSAANAHFASNMKMTATKPVKQEEFLAVDIHNDIEMEPESGDSNVDISINQRIQNISGTNSVMQNHLASKTGKLPKQVNFPIEMKGEDASIVHSLDAPFGNFDSPTSEIGKPVWPLSNKLNFGQVKLEQFGTSDVKQAVSDHDLSQAAVGRSQGHSASKIGKLASMDSMPKLASGSFKANVKDVPSNHLYNVSVPCEEASNNGEQLQTQRVNSNIDPAMRDHQGMSMASSHISGDDSKHVPVSRSFGDEGTNTSKTAKQSSVDSVPEQTHVSGGFRWGLFGQTKTPAANVNNAVPTETEIGAANGKHTGSIVHSMDAKLRNLDSLTSETVKQVRPLSDILNFGQVKLEQPGTSDVKQAMSVHHFRQADVGISQGNSTPNVSKVASIDLAHKWAHGSFKDDVKDVPHNLPSNVSVACEESSSIGVQVQDPVNLNNDPALQDQEEMPITSAHIFGDDQQEMQISGSHLSIDFSRHDLVSRHFRDQGTNTSKTGKQFSIDPVPSTVHASRGSRSGIFGQVKPPALNVNNAAPTETEIGVANGKHSGPSDYPRQVPAAGISSPLGLSASNKGKQKPPDLIPNQAKDSGLFMSENSKDVSSLSAQASNNAMSRDPSRISISRSPVSRDGGPSEHARNVFVGTGSSALGYSASNNGKQKPLDSTPKQVNHDAVSISHNSKAVPLTSVQESNISMSRDPSRISGSKNPVPRDDTNPVDSSPSSQRNHASIIGKQASTSGGSRWGIFSASRSAVVESPSHPTGVTEAQAKKVSTPRSAVVGSPSHPTGVTNAQAKKIGAPRSAVVESPGHPAEVRTEETKKDQHYSPEEQNIGASRKAVSGVEPRYLHPQNQRHVPVGSVGTTVNQVTKQAPKESPAKVVDKPMQTRWGIFSMRAPSKPADGKEKPEG